MNALDLWGMVLEPGLAGEPWQRGEASLQHGIARDLAFDVANDRLRRVRRNLSAANPPELMGMAVAADHDGGALGDRYVALA